MSKRTTRSSTKSIESAATVLVSPVEIKAFTYNPETGENLTIPRYSLQVPPVLDSQASLVMQSQIVAVTPPPIPLKPALKFDDNILTQCVEQMYSFYWDLEVSQISLYLSQTFHDLTPFLIILVA
jgi:hypothetical protein